MSQSSSKRIVLGRITGVHGIRGDVVVRTHTADPADIASYGPMTDKSGTRVFEIEQLRVTTKGVVLRFKGITDRTSAEGLSGLELYVDRSQLPAADDGSYYHVDLIGLSVIEPTGAEIGRIVAVQDFGGGTLLEIQKYGTAQTDLVPFTDSCVPIVDIAAGHVVAIIPGMVGEPEPASENQGDGDA